MVNFFKRKEPLSVSQNNPIKSELIQKGNLRSLYKTKDNLLFWLDENKYLDQCIIDTGVFEKDSTCFVKRILRTGDIVLDVGANIGYYSVLMSNLVKDNGRVICFEPVAAYRDILLQNIAINGLNNCQVYDFGLSNHETELEISVGECSATLHWVNDQPPSKTVMIKLKILDNIISSLNLEKIDLIKVDIDGHEPAFLEGALATIEKYKPVIILEVSHEHYLDYGITAWEFYTFLKDKGFFIYSETDLVEFKTKREFLYKCGNFTHSANIIISKKQI
jgi:FkbM family methyltransferase